PISSIIETSPDAIAPRFRVSRAGLRFGRFFFDSLALESHSMSSALSNIFARLPVSFTHGQGVWLWDANGRRYLDGLSGIGVSALGHAHPRLVAAIAEQAARVLHVSNLYEVPQQEALAQRLIELSGMNEVAFTSSGSEANETALKLARL